MNNAFQTEILKLKKNKMTFVGFIITISVPVLLILKSLLIDKTIINIITAPVDRKNFIFSKIFVWFSWYLITMIIPMCLTILGLFVLYHSQITNQIIFFTIKILFQIGILSFASFIPIVWISIRQRTLFYPSMLCTLIFVLLQSVGSQISEELLPIAIFIPWLAVKISTMLPLNNYYLYICIGSILCLGFLGIILSIQEFKKQDL